MSCHVITMRGLWACAAMVTRVRPMPQICAAGALLNLLGPAVSDTEDPSDPQRVALRSLLSDGIALGAIMHCMTEPSTAANDAALLPDGTAGTAPPKDTVLSTPPSAV